MGAKDYAYLKDEGFQDAPIPAVVRGIYKTMRKVGDPVSVANVSAILKAHKLEAPEPVIKKVLARLVQMDKKPASDVMGLAMFRGALQRKVGAEIKGLKGANKLLEQHGLKGEVSSLINKTNAGNMFKQHSDNKVRYDVQDSAKDAQNYQIQLGGTGLKVKRPSGGGGTSVTAVLVSNDILELTDNSKEILGHMAGLMKTAHADSFRTGKVVTFSLK